MFKNLLKTHGHQFQIPLPLGPQNEEPGGCWTKRRRERRLPPNLEFDGQSFVSLLSVCVERESLSVNKPCVDAFQTWVERETLFVLRKSGEKPSQNRDHGKTNRARNGRAQKGSPHDLRRLLGLSAVAAEINSHARREGNVNGPRKRDGPDCLGTACWYNGPLLCCPVYRNRDPPSRCARTGRIRAANMLNSGETKMSRTQRIA